MITVNKIRHHSYGGFSPGGYVATRLIWAHHCFIKLADEHSKYMQRCYECWVCNEEGVALVRTFLYEDQRVFKATILQTTHQQILTSEGPNLPLLLFR